MSLIDDYLSESITITPKGTVQVSGDYPHDGTAVSTRARVMDQKIRTRSPQGDEIIYDRVFWLSPNETITTGDRITWNSETHEVIQIYRGTFLIGAAANHYKVMTRVV